MAHPKFRWPISIGALGFGALMALMPIATKAAGEPPLQIAKEGWLFAGGHVDQSDPVHPMVGQIYVEYQIPAHRTHPYPVVMVHGGHQNGTNFTATPDGREGWAQYFLRHGYAVYVVDTPGRGRSAYDQKVYGPTTAPGVEFTEKHFSTPEKYNLWPQARLHTQWPGAGVPGDPAFDQYLASENPSIGFPEQQKLMAVAGADLLDRIGPAILLLHSQAGAFGWPIAQARPNLVKAIVDVEPSGPPVHELDEVGPPEWFKDLPKVKISGLGDVPLQYDPPLKPGEELKFQQAAAPLAPGLARCWAQAEPARKLVGMEHVDLLMVSSEASYHAPYDDCTEAYLRQAGVKLEHIHLAKLGIHGNSHMMMLEKNNQAIAAVMVDWLNKQAVLKR